MAEFGTFYYEPDNGFPAAKLKDLGLGGDGQPRVLVVVWTDSDTRRITAKVAAGPGQQVFVVNP
jgi:hypothetical protein